MASHPTDPNDPTDPTTPIEATFVDTNGEISYTFTEGTATLNGEPYTSGTAITDADDYVLVITDGSRVTEVRFTIDAEATDPTTPIVGNFNEDAGQIVYWIIFLIVGIVFGYVLNDVDCPIFRRKRD